MHTANLRKVGGSVTRVIPGPLLDLLGVGPGSTVGLSVRDGRLVVEPRTRPRYTLDELLAQGGEPDAALSDEDEKWFSARPVGREII